MKMKPKLFIIGIDSATWLLIDRWCKSNDLPNFKNIIHKGLGANLLSTTPPLTPVAWSSFYTGLNPGRHGIMDFYTLDSSKKLKVYTSKDRHGKTFWQMLDEKGYKCCIYNLPNTYPPSTLRNGIVFSGFTTPSFNTQFIKPKKTLEEFRKRFPDYLFNEDKRYDNTEVGREEFFQSLVNLTKTNIKVSNWLFEKKDWDLFATNFMTVDHIQHWFWKFNDPTYPGYNKKEALNHKDKILKIYQIIDDYIGDILPILKKRNFNLMVISDHGAGPHYKNVYINNLLKKEKLLFLRKSPYVMIKQILSKLGLHPHNVFRLGMKLGFGKRGTSTETKTKGGLISKLLFTFNDINWDKTKAYSFGYYGNIHLNKKSISSKRERDRVEKKIKEILKNLKDPETNKHIVDNVWSKKEVYHGEYTNDAPDILFSMGNYAYASSMRFAFASNKLFAPTLTFKSGEHKPNGIFIVSGPLAKDNHKRLSINICDVTATILNLFGYRYTNLDSTSKLKEFFTTSQIESTKVVGKEDHIENIVI